MSRQVGACSGQKTRKYVKYDNKTMGLALEQVRSGSMSQRQAALTYGVPRTTLVDKLHGRTPELCRPGPPPVITAEDEQKLADHVKAMARAGFPFTRKALLLEVKSLLDRDCRTVACFKDNLPGKDWYAAFMRRHPELTIRTPNQVGHRRAQVSLDMVKGWLSGMANYLHEHRNADILSQPQRIFNLDESGFPLNPATGGVLAEKGCKNVYQRVSEGKEQITVLCCMSASGMYLPPLILFSGKRLRSIDISDFPSAHFATSDSGWMTSEVFCSFLAMFNNYVVKQNITKPVLLLLDGHASHNSLQAAKFCKENGIILFSLLANATHIIQPCDISLFGPLKAAWKEAVRSWHATNPGKQLLKRNFGAIFKKAWESCSANGNIARNGFKKAGIFPYDPSAIDASRLLCDPSPAASSSTPPALAPPSLAPSFAPSSFTTALASLPPSLAPPLASLPPPSLAPSSFTPALASLPPSLAPPLASLPPPALASMPSPALSQLSFGPPSAPTSPTPPPIPLEPTIIILNPTDVTTVVSTSTSLPSTSSSSFDTLTVPSIPTEKRRSNLSARLPHAISGEEAIAILSAKENQRLADELAKEQRKAEREQKRIEREMAKKQNGRKRGRKSKKQPEPAVDDTDTEICAECHSGVGEAEEWVGCETCPQWYHIRCAGDENLLDMAFEDLASYCFVCLKCADIAS